MKITLFILLMFLNGALYADTLRLGTGEFPPYTSESLQLDGITTALVTKALNKAGYEKIDVKYLPWARGYKMVSAGELDATYPYAWTPERAEKFIYSQPIVIGYLAWYSNGLDRDVLSMKWEGKEVCIPQGFSTFHADETIKKFNMKLQKPRLMEQCIKLLRKNKVDLIPMNNLVFSFEVKKVLGEECPFIELPFLKRNVYYYLIAPKEGRASQSIIEKFNLALLEMRASGEDDNGLTIKACGSNR